MSDNYNANIYLTTEDLNNIEDRIENITEECQERIFGKENVTYRGTNFQINASNVENGYLTSLEGQTTQTGTPTPTSPQPINVVSGRQEVSVVGKNLLDISDITTGGFITNNGDGSITLNGTGSSGVSFTLKKPFTLKANTTYTMSLTNTNSSYSAGTFILRNGNTNIFLINYNVSSVSYTPTQDVIIDIIRIFPGGLTFDNFTFSVQLEKGNQATTYEEYKCNDYEINLGKNLANIENIQIGKSWSNVANTNRATILFIPVEKNQQYSLVSSYTNQSITQIRGVLNKGPNDQVSSLVVNGTFKNDSNWTYMSIEVIANTTFTSSMLDGVKIMLCKGTATINDYAPYKTPIYLGEIGNYKDYIFKNTTENPLYDSNLEEGQWYIHKEIGRYDFTGTENFSASQWGTNSWDLSNIIATTFNTNELQIMSNLFKGVPHANRGTGGNNIIYTTSNNGFEIRNTTYSTLTDIRNATKGSYIYWVLATPTNTLIEDEELINQLNSIQLITGLNNINVSSSNLPAIISIYKYFSNALRNIRVGDNLSGKTLYLSFPRTTYESIPDTDTSTHMFIAIATNNTVIGICYKYYLNSNKAIGVRVKDDSSETGYIIKYLYSYSLTTNNGNPYLNFVRFTLPLDYGVVTSIDANSEFYQYVKIYDESIIPNYTKHTWVDNELLTMQKIDNIERGVRNIGFYYEKPNGWVQEKEWLPDSNKNYAGNYGVGIKTISYQDLNRWYNNLDLIDFSDLNNITIWNAKNDITQLTWNEDSDVEWVDGFITMVSPLIGG